MTDHRIGSPSGLPGLGPIGPVQDGIELTDLGPAAQRAESEDFTKTLGSLPSTHDAEGAAAQDLKMLKGFVESRNASKEVKAFLANVERMLVSSPSCGDGSRVMEFARRASECDYQFKQRCVGLLGNGNGPLALGTAYRDASTPAQRAFVELCGAFALASGLRSDLSKSAGDELSDEAFASIQGDLTELLAAGAEDTVAARDRLLENVRKQCCLSSAGVEVGERFRATIQQLAANKLNAVADLRAAAEGAAQVARDLATANPDRLPQWNLRFEGNSQEGGIPSMMGIHEVIHDGSENESRLDSYQKSLGKINEFRSFSAEINQILGARNLKNLTVEQLRFRNQSEGLGNKFIEERLNAHSKAAMDALGKELAGLLMSPDGGNNLARTLDSLAQSIRRDLTHEHGVGMAKMASTNLAKLCAEFSKGTEPSANLLALQGLMGQIQGSPQLQDHFPEIMGLLSANGFDFSGLAALGGYTNGDQASFTECAGKVITGFAGALADPGGKGVGFVDSLANAQSKEPLFNTALKSLLGPLSMQGNDLLSQKCQGFYDLPLIKRAATFDLQHWDEVVDKVGPRNEEQLRALKDALVRVITGEGSKVSESDLRTILDAAANQQLRNCGLIWNTLLHSAYHLNMAGQLASGAIDEVPAQLHSVSTLEVAPDGEGTLASPGEQARDDFVASLPAVVRERMDSTAQGLLRKDHQQGEVDQVTESLNSIASGLWMRDLLTASTTAGKRLSAMAELRQEVASLSDHAVLRTDQIDGMANEDDLVGVGVSVSSLVNSLNQEYHGASEEYSRLVATRNSLIANPAITRLQELQGVGPGEPPRGEEVATAMILLRDNLIDSLEDLSPDRLRELGIDPSACILKEQDFEYGFKLNLNQAMNEVAETDGVQLVNGLSLEAERVRAFRERADNAILALRSRIAGEAQQRPLTTLGRLLVRQYVKTMAARYGANYSTFLATIATDYGAAPQGRGTETEMQELDPTRPLSLFQELQEHARHPGGTFPEGARAVEGLILNDLCSQLGLPDEDAESMLGVLGEPLLDDAGKRELIRSLATSVRNVDPETMLTSDPRDGELSTFSSRLRDLAGLEGPGFRDRLSEFVNQELTPGRLASANALLLHLRGAELENSEEGTLSESSLKVALSEGALGSGTLAPALARFKDCYETRIEAQGLARLGLNQAESEQVRKINLDLLGSREIRSLMRLAGSYAAVKLGYASYNETFARYAANSVPDSEKARILGHMVDALQKRGLEPSLATLLARARLTQSDYDHLGARAYTYLRNTVLGVIGSLRETYHDIRDSAEQKSINYQNDYATYLPMMQEVIQGLGSDESKYVDGTRELSLNLPIKQLLSKIIPGLSSSKAKIGLALTRLSDSGFVLSRGENNHVRLDISESTMYGVSANFLNDTEVAKKGVGAHAKASVGGGNVLNLDFDSDEKAAVFLCKMLLGKLESSDVALAREAASGVEAKIQASAGGSLKLDEDDPIAGLRPAQKDWLNKPKKNPILAGIGGKTDFSHLEAGINYNSSTRVVSDYSGTREETSTQFTVDSNLRILARQAYNDLTEDFLELIGRSREEGDRIEEGRDSSYVNQQIDDIRHVNINTTNQVHYSLGRIDGATQETRTADLTIGHIRELRRLGMVNKDLESRLVAASKGGYVSGVSVVYRLKPSVIAAYESDPRQLKIEAENVADNYDFTEMRIEMRDQGAKEKVFDLLGTVTMGFVSLAQGTTLEGSHYLSLRPSAL